MPSNLGKRKEREEDSSPDAHGSTLFVSNLPYTATSVDLETLFSDIAPVRSAFVVTEQGTGVSKGVGYVSFALKEDAETCYTKMSEEGLALAGRKIRIQWADKKEKKPREEGTDQVKKEIKSRPERTGKAVARGPHDPLAIRTVIVSGLPNGIDSNVLWKKIRKYQGAEKLIWPIKKDDGEDDPTVAHIVFSKPSTAQDAVNKLHAHVYKGSLLSVTLKKRLEHLAKPTIKNGATPAEASVATTAPNRASRLIVRNLPFNVTEQDLRVLFLPYGPIHSINLPKAEPTADGAEAESRPSSTRNKGFAFIWMLSKKDAEKALEGCNGKSIRAGMANELVSDKQKRKKQRRLEKKMNGEAKVEGDADVEAKGDDEEAEEEEKEDTQKVIERVIAVDWALSKEKWKEELEKLQDEAEDEDGDVKMGDADSASDASNSDSESEDEDGGLGVHEGDDEDGSEAGSSQDERDEDEVPVKPQLPPPETGETLFIRNLPYEASEDELRTLFRAFGPLRYARIAIDPATGRSRGTGFACFWNKEDADKAVEQSNILRLETTGQAAAPKKNPFSLPSILTPDPSSSMARNLVLHGRTLDVVRAVTRDVATKLKEEGEKLREKQDKRNMYLLREGVILPNSPAAANLSPADLERRTASFSSRKALLKSNPSLFISRTRLSVRQAPIFVTERMLKRLAIHTVRAFESEVKAGERQPLSADELSERAENDLDDVLKEEDEAPKKKDKKSLKGKGRDTGVKQTKIVRQAERVDPVTGKGRSKGYGFLEMHKHADALRVLRWANNNPGVNPLFEQWWKEELEELLKKEKALETKDEARIKRIKDEIEGGSSKKKEGRGTLIVEFSIENVQVVQRRNTMQKERKDRPAEPAHTSGTTPQGKSPLKDKKRKKGSRPAATADDEEPSKEPSKKRRKVEKEASDEKPAKVEADKPKKAFNPVGAVIGRKRKERKLGKKGK